MNKIIREHVPVSDLPAHPREGFEPTADVKVTIESQPVEPPTGPVMTLEAMFAPRGPNYRTTEEVVAEIRRIRDGSDE